MQTGAQSSTVLQTQTQVGYQIRFAMKMRLTARRHRRCVSNYGVANTSANLLCELDAPNEFYVERTKGLLSAILRIYMNTPFYEH